MKLTFEREVIILSGFPVIGAVEVEITGQRDRWDDWDLEISIHHFEPESFTGKLPGWQDACEAWLVENEDRVRRKFDRLCIQGVTL